MKPGCSGHWTCGSRRERGVAVTIQKEGFLHGESYRELANKLASDRAKSKKRGAVEVAMVVGGVGIHLARHSCSCLWLSLTASATLLQSTCVCSLAFPQSARKML